MAEVDIKKSSNFLEALMIIFLFVLVFSLIMFVWHKKTPQREIVSVNVTHLLSGFKSKVVKISDGKKLAKIVKAYANILSSTLNKYAQDNNYEIVSYKVVVAGIPDKTKEVEDLINATFKIPVSHTHNSK